jgi:hypothetical protein
LAVEKNWANASTALSGVDEDGMVEMDDSERGKVSIRPRRSRMAKPFVQP